MEIRDKVVEKEKFDVRNGWGMGNYGTRTLFESGFEEIITKTQYRHTGISTTYRYKFNGYGYIYSDNKERCGKVSILENSLGQKAFTFGDVKKILTKELPKRERYNGVVLTYDEYVESVQKHCLFKQVELLE